MLELTSVPITIHRVRGKDNSVADYISRLPRDLLPSPDYLTKKSVTQLSAFRSVPFAAFSQVQPMKLRDRSKIAKPRRLTDDEYLPSKDDEYIPSSFGGANERYRREMEEEIKAFESDAYDLSEPRGKLPPRS